jgi:hypothetical protein
VEAGNTPNDEPATDDDIRDAIEALTEDDALRLRKAAQAFLLGTEYQDPNELINEAVVRAMDRTMGDQGRHWPKRRVPFVAFMIMTMMSIADGSRESHHMSRTDRLEGLALEGEGADHVLDYLGFSTQSVEDEALDVEEEAAAIARAKVDADRIDALFADDQQVAWLVMCIKEGKSPAKARALAGFTTTEYETIRKRLRRGAAKLFPGRRSA